MTGCNVTKDYHRPDIITDSLYTYDLKPDSSSIAYLSWEQKFTDTTLKSLIREGIENNLDLKIAVQRIKESESLFKQKGADKLPTLDFGVKGSVSRLSKNALDGANPDVPDPLANYNIFFLKLGSRSLGQTQQRREVCLCRPFKK